MARSYITQAHRAARTAPGASGEVNTRERKPVRETRDPRATAAWVLGEIGDPRAVEPLIEALHDQSPEVRACAVEALGKLKDRRAVAELIPFLQDGDAQVRGRAAAALSAITGQSFGEDAERWRAWLQADAA